MNTGSRFRVLLHAALFGWIAGCLFLAPFQLFEAARNAGWKAATATPGLFAEMLGLSISLWIVLSLLVAGYCCCMFLAPIVWFIAPEKIVANRSAWVIANILFGTALMALRAHIWTALYHDGVGLDNFWVWGLFAAIFLGVTAEGYFRYIRNTLATVRERTHASQPG